MSDRVRLNVGGKIFETSRLSLAAAGRDSLLGALLDPVWSQQQQSDDFSGAGSYAGSSSSSGGTARALPPPPPEIFIDRDPKVFRSLLNLMRTGVLDVPPGTSMETLAADADYCGLLDSVKAALHPPLLDPNEMEKVGVIRPNVGPSDSVTALVGTDDGGVDMAHGSRITSYDWLMRRTQTIISELAQVDALCRISETHLIAGGTKNIDRLPVYDQREGAKCQTIDCHGSHPAIRSIVASDRFLFVASLRKTVGAEWGVGKGVGVIDKVTLQAVGEAGPTPITTRRLGGPDKLQWLPSRNLLLVTRRYTAGIAGLCEGTSYARLWDPRSNTLVWDWREFDDPQASMVPADRWCALCDATVCEDLSLLFKASPSGSDTSSRLSIFDLRKLATSASALSTSTSARLTPSMGHDEWSVLQWQSPEGGLRIGGTPPRDPRIESQALRLLLVPERRQVICNRQPSLEVWTPVCEPLAPESPVAVSGGGLSIGGVFAAGSGASWSHDGPVSPDGFMSFRRGFKAESSSKGTSSGETMDPFLFRRYYADAKEEYLRRKSNCSTQQSWVYDMALGGNRLFLAREDNRGTGGGVEVWESHHRSMTRI